MGSIRAQESDGHRGSAARLLPCVTPARNTLRCSKALWVKSSG